MSSMARKDLAVTREEAPSPEAVPKQDEDPPISPIRQRTVSFADQHHPGHNRSKAAQKAQATNKERDGQSSETASSEPVYEASDSGSSERTASLYDGISSADSNPPTDVYRRADDFTDSDSERAPVRFRSNSVDSVGVGFSLEPPRRATRSGPMPSIAQVYNPTVDRHTIHPGLNTAMGSHQGSMVKADTMTQLALGVISKSALDKPGGGLIIIKKLLTRKTMAEVMKNNRNAFETPYDEEFLEICEDKDSHEKLARLIDSAINLERSREPFVKDPSCAIIYLDNCTEAFKVLDEFFELKKSSWGSGDEDFLLWATGNEHAARENRSFRHSISRARRSLLKRTLPNPRGRLGVHPSEQIPESFCWEPFGFEYLLYLTKDKSMDTDDISKVSKSNVRRLMFTFEFLVPYKCKKRDCDEPRKLLQCGTDTHFHMFVQRRSVLVQNAGSTIAGFHLTPSQDNLCIIADMPVMTNRTSLTSAERPLEQTTESPDVTKRNENLRKRFYRAVGSSKYRFRPAFSLNQESENWYTPALIYFILKDIIECWTPVVQVCIKHVEFREKSVLQDVTLNTHTRNLWEDKQHWIYLRTTLDAHIGNISRLRSYILETFNARLDFMEEMSTDLASRYTEVEKRLEKQLQERTNNLVDLVFSSINSEDAHISAETGTSMWRLSWITFVFLPLTFLAGVFGMNVETFANPENVYIKWYFVTAILMLVFVIAVIWVLKKRIGWKRMLYSIRSVKDACNRAISRIRKSRAKDDADLEANAHLFSETDSESDEPEKDAESTKKQDDKLEATEDDGTTVEPPRGKVSNGEKGSRLNGAADTPSEDVQDEENPDTSDPPEDSNRDREVTIVADILRREQESELGYRGNKEREVDNSRERLRINEVERRQREEILEYEPNLQRERARRRERDRRDMMLERQRMESGNESGSDSSSTNKKRVREADVARTHKPQPKRRNAMVDEKALEDLDDVEDVRIKGRYQASIEDDTDLKGSKRIRSILSTKSMFGGEYEKNMRKYSVELDSTPVSSSSKFQPRDLDIDLSYIPPLNDVKVRIAMLFGYSGYNAMVYCEDTSSSIVIEINSIKNFCNLEHGYEYTGLIRYGTPYTHGHMDGREDPFNISWPPQMTERDFLQPRKAQLQAFYGIMLYFLSSLRPALEAIYKIESTEDKIIFKPHIEINFVASQLICASEHIRDLITEFNEENQFNAKIIALTPTHVAVDGMASKFYGNTARAQSPNLPTLRPQNSQKPRYALLRRQDNLWVYDLNTAKSLDERDEDPSNSYSCPGEEGQWFSPSSVNSAIQEYLSMLTQRNIMWYDREDTVCMDIVPVLQEESIFSRYLGLPRHLKPWQDSFMEEFDWLLSEGDGCGPPQKLKISEGSDDSETNVCHEPGIRFYTTTDPSVAPFYTDVGFTTTEKVLKMTVNTLTKTIRKVADGSYAEQSDKEKHKPSHLQILKDRKSTGPAANRRNLREREGSSELPLVVLVGNIGDDATDHPLPLNMWNRVRNALDGEVDLQMYRGRDVVASVMGMDMIQNAQRRMTFDITTGRLWEYPNEVMREETAD